MSLPMKQSFGLVVLTAAVIPLIQGGHSRCVNGAESGNSSEERVLQEAGLQTDDASLLDFLRLRSNDGNLNNITLLVRQLEDQAFAKRQEASGKLQALGLRALPALRRGLTTTGGEGQHRCRTCIQAISDNSFHQQAESVVRLLLRRKPSGTDEVLLRYLPYAEEYNAEDVWFGLYDLARSNGKVVDRMVPALNDPFPERRSVAAWILGRLGDEKQKASAREILRDPDTRVRVRAALGLLGGKDTTAMPVLLDMLEEASTFDAGLVEGALEAVSGTYFWDDLVDAECPLARKRCREAWQAWWANNEPRVNADQVEAIQFRARLLAIPGQARFRETDTSMIYLQPIPPRLVVRGREVEYLTIGPPLTFREWASEHRERTKRELIALIGKSDRMRSSGQIRRQDQSPLERGHRPIEHFIHEGSIVYAWFSPENRLTNRHMRLIAVGFSQVQRLGLGGSPEITDAGLEFLSTLTKLGSLDSLGKGITDQGLKHLRGCRDLRFLCFTETKISGNGFKYLGELPNFERLELRRCPVGDEVLEHIGRLTSLQALDLSETRISDEGLKHLRQLKGIEELDLSGTRITDQGLKHLRNLPKLKYLKMSATQITDAGLEFVGELTSVHELTLARTKITTKGLKNLESLAELTNLDLRGNDLRGPGIDSLQKALPELIIKLGPAE